MPNFWRFNIADITHFVIGSRDRGIKKINLVKEVLIKTYFIISSWRKKYFSQEKTYVTEELNIFASATKSNISWFQTFVNFPKDSKMVKLCFAKFLTSKYFGHGQYFIWEFSVLEFIETARQETTSFRIFSWFGNDTVLVFNLCMSSL